MNRARQAILNTVRRFLLPDQKETRQLALTVLALVLLAAVAANGLPFSPETQASLAPTATATPAVDPSPTATSSVQVPHQNETDGMIIGGVILVLIILGGTLQVLRPRAQE